MYHVLGSAVSLGAVLALAAGPRLASGAEASDRRLATAGRAAGPARRFRAGTRPSWLASGDESASFVEVGGGDSDGKKPGCNGPKKKRAHDKYNSWCDDEVGLFMLNGKLTRSTWCLSQPDVGKAEEQCASSAAFKKCTFMYFACKAPKSAAKKCCVGWEEPLCDGKEATFEENAKANCKKRFGPKSVWDEEHEGCTGIMKNCKPGFEDTCCTQPEGAMNLDDYCAEEQKRVEEKGGDIDPACKADPVIGNIKANLMELPQVVDGVSASALNATNAATNATQKAAEAVVAEAAGEEAKPDAANQADKGNAANSSASNETVGPAAGGEPSTASANASATARAAAEATASAEEKEAPAEVAAREARELHAKDVERQKAKCDTLTRKMDTMKSDVLSLFKMKENKEFGDYDQDPDLNGKVDETIKVGDSMPKGSPCVVKEVEADDDEDEQEDAAADADADAETGNASRVPDEMREAGGEGRAKDKRLEVRVRRKKLVSVETDQDYLRAMMAWASNMTAVIGDIETGIHPHGCKWWRYRYQYTVVEILLLLVVVPLHFRIIFTLLYCGGLTGELQERQRQKLDPMHLYHYAYLAFVFHCTAIAIVGFIAWGLWWSTDFWDWFARMVRFIVSEGYLGSAWPANTVPFFGQSYYWQLKEMLFHLFGGFALFTLLVLVILREYSRAHFEWKHMENEAEGAEVGPMIYTAGAYTHYETLKVNAATHFKAMAEQDRGFESVLTDLGMGPDGTIHKFKFYRYLTLALNTSGASLALPSWPTVLAMLLYFFAILVLAFTMKLPWLFFLWPFVVAAIVMFAVFWALSRYLERVAEELPPRDKAPMPWLTIERFSSTVQIILILVCYSFTRLIFSHYVWQFYFWLGVRATVGFVVIFLLVWFLASRICKHTVCSLALPPNGSREAVLEDLKYVASAERQWCACGNKFQFDSDFCRKCGAPKPGLPHKSTEEFIRDAPPQTSGRGR